MPVDCPHCSKALPDEYLTQDQIKNRIADIAKARDKAIADAAKAADEAAAVQARAAAEVRIANEKADAASAASTKALADLGRAQSERDRFQALAAEGITKPAKVRGLSLAYDAYAAEAGDKAKAFNDWLASDARSDEFLAPHFAKPAEPAKPEADAGKAAAEPAATAKAEPAKPAGAAAPPAGKPLPSANVGVGEAPLVAGKLTEAQMAERYNAGVRDIRAKYPDRKDRPKRDAEIRELEQKLAGAQAGPAV